MQESQLHGLERKPEDFWKGMTQMYRIIRSPFIASMIAVTMMPLVHQGMAANAADVTVNLTSTKQIIDGFGASSAWCGAIKDNVMNPLYGDLGFSILRLRIEEGIADNWKTGNFSKWADELSNAKKAAAKGAIVFASPWNPPKSMQENFTKTGDASAQRLRTDKYEEYLQYLNAYAKYMKDNGVELHSISIQNEPDYAQDWNWWTPTEMLNFMKTHAGSINAKVMAPESFQYLKNMSDPILNDATALANMDILGFHLYGTPVNQFAYPLFQQKGVPAGKKAWMTEHYFDTDNITDVMALGKELHDCMVTGNMNAYVYWWITWPNGLAEASSGTIYKRAYAIGQFSKHIRPGYYRVDATATPATNVYVSAYSGAGKAVIVAVNTGTSAVNQKFSFQGGSVAQLSMWETTPSKNMVAGSAVTVTGGSFTASLPAQSITTFVGTNTSIAINPRHGEAAGNVKLVRRNGSNWVGGLSQESGRLEVITMDGREIESHAISAGTNEMRLETNKSGVYLVKVIQGRNSNTAPLAIP